MGTALPSEEYMLQLQQEHRRIILSGQINTDSVNRCRKSLFELALDSREDIVLLIDSSGGYTIPSLVLYDCITSLGVPVMGVVVGKAHSAALTILQACTLRFMTSHATLLMHNPILGISDISITDDWRKKVERAIEETLLRKEKIVSIFCKRTGFSRRRIEALLNRGSRLEYVIDCEEALKLRLFDHVLPEGSSPFFGDLRVNE